MLENNNKNCTVFNASLGFSLFLGMLVTSFIVFTPESQLDSSNPLTFIFHLFFHFKALTLVAFLFGVYLARISSSPQKIQHYHRTTSILLIVSLVLSFFVSQILMIVAFIITGATVLSLKSLNSKAILAIAFVFYTISAVFSIPEIGRDLQIPDLIRLIYNSNEGPTLGKAFQLITRPEEIANIFYGFALILVGYLIEKNNWLSEYPFRYRQLKLVAMVALAGIILWLVFIKTGFYGFIIQYKIGQAFFMMDALFINGCIVFIYVFILISLENFKWGKAVLTHLSYIGKLSISWFILYFITQLLLGNFSTQAPLLIAIIPVSFILVLGFIGRFYFRKFKKDPVLSFINILVKRPKD